MGSKARIAHEILPIILKDREPDQLYIEPFVGGCNTIDKVTGKRAALDSNPYLIAMWDMLVLGWEPPKEVTRAQYEMIRDHPDIYEDELVGWVGFNCSYSGKFFGGYAGKTRTAIGTIRDYQAEAYRNTMKQVPLLKGVTFSVGSYEMLDPVGCIVYCDPPYQGVTGYKDTLDYNKYWDWVRKISRNNQVFCSEYSAPADFECVWEKPVKSSLSANGKYGKSLESIERLFVIR